MKISHPDINSRLIINEDIVITYPKYYDDKNPDFIYNNDIYKTFIFPSHNYDYNNFIKNNLKYMNIKIHNINYVDDAFIDSIAKQRQYFSFIPVSMCKELGIPYIKDSNLIIRTFIYLSSAKNNILSEANLNMYQFIEKYLMNRQAFYVV